MPESPEVLFNAILLNKVIQNTKITYIHATNEERALNLPIDSNGHVIGVFTKGKLMWITVKKNETENYFIHIHFGTKGKLETDKPNKYLRYEMRFEKGDKTINIYMEDSDFRQLAKITLHTQQEHDEIIDKLGVSIFSPNFTKEFFTDTIKSKKIKLITLLMNQHVFSGIGNYIKNDSLYMANIDVMANAKDVSTQQIHVLYDKIMFVAYSVLMTNLREINNLTDVGITLNDDIFANMPNVVEVPYNYKIYGRKTTDNGKPIKKIKIDGRDTYVVAP